MILLRTLVWTGPRQLVVQEQDRPVPEPGDVLLRVRAVGICGSEISGYLGENSLRKPPLIMGHEFSAEVVDSAGVAGLAPGDRVVVNPLTSCGTCRLCRAGLPNLCRQRRIVGIHRAGAFAEYVAVPARCCHPIAETVTDLDGTLVEPLACAVRAVARAGIGLGSSVCVLGCGPIGLLAIACAIRAGATTVAAVDINPRRLQVAGAWGARMLIRAPGEDPAVRVQQEWDPLGMDAAIDAVGLPVTRLQAVNVTRPGGTVVLVGLHENAATLPCNDAVRSELDLRGSFSYADGDFAAALTLVAQGAIKADDSWVAVQGLEQAGRCFEELVAGTTAVEKIILVP